MNREADYPALKKVVQRQLQAVEEVIGTSQPPRAPPPPPSPRSRDDFPDLSLPPPAGASVPPAPRGDKQVKSASQKPTSVAPTRDRTPSDAPGPSTSGGPTSSTLGTGVRPKDPVSAPSPASGPREPRLTNLFQSTLGRLKVPAGSQDDQRERMVARYGPNAAELLDRHGRALTELARGPTGPHSEITQAQDASGSVSNRFIENSLNTVSTAVRQARGQYPWVNTPGPGDMTVPEATRRYIAELDHLQSRIHEHRVDLSRLTYQTSYEEGICAGAREMARLQDTRIREAYERGLAEGRALQSREAPPAPPDVQRQRLELEAMREYCGRLDAHYDEAVRSYSRLMRIAAANVGRSDLPREQRDVESVLFPTFARWWHQRTDPLTQRNDYLQLHMLAISAGHRGPPPSVTAPDIPGLPDPDVLLASLGLRPSLPSRQEIMDRPVPDRANQAPPDQSHSTAGQAGTEPDQASDA